MTITFSALGEQHTDYVTKRLSRRVCARIVAQGEHLGDCRVQTEVGNPALESKPSRALERRRDRLLVPPQVDPILHDAARLFTLSFHATRLLCQISGVLSMDCDSSNQHARSQQQFQGFSRYQQQSVYNALPRQGLTSAPFSPLPKQRGDRRIFVARFFQLNPLAKRVSNLARVFLPRLPQSTSQVR